MTEPPHPSGSPGSDSAGPLARTPGRAAGIVTAVVAVLLLLVPVLEIVLLDESTDPVVAIRIFLGLNAVALLGFLPLLRAVHAVMGRPARPAWLLLAAYLVLLIRPLVLTVEVAAAPVAVFGGPGFFYALLGTTGVAAGLAAVALQPTHDPRGEPVGSPLRSVVIGVGTGFFVALTLFAFAPYIAPLTALGIAVALGLRKPPLPPEDLEGAHGEDDR